MTTYLGATALADALYSLKYELWTIASQSKAADIILMYTSKINLCAAIRHEGLHVKEYGMVLFALCT